MILQSIIPVANFAKESTPYQEKEQEENLNRVKLGTLDAKDYPKIDTKTILAINKQKRDEINGKPMKRAHNLLMHLGFQIKTNLIMKEKINFSEGFM